MLRVTFRYCVATGQLDAPSGIYRFQHDTPDRGAVGVLILAELNQQAGEHVAALLRAAYMDGEACAHAAIRRALGV